jgi:hypothetical protein
MIRKLLIIVFLISTGYIAFAGKKKKKKENEVATTEAVKDTTNYRLQGAPLPPVKFYMKNGKYLTNKELENDANLFILLFNPTCEHCQSHTNVIQKNISLLKKSQFLFIAAPQMKEYLSFFEATTHISQYPSLQMGLDSNQYIEKVFSYQALPQINVYGPDRKLIRAFVGETHIDTLKPYFQ